MTYQVKKEDFKEDPKAIPLATFFESTPPSQMTLLVKLFEKKLNRHSGNYYLEMLTPEIQLHCPDDACNGLRFFRCTSNAPILKNKEYTFVYLTYTCSNCQKKEKIFSVAVSADGASGTGFKFGEHPTYGPPTPARLITLIGPDRELFLKGRRCENQGLGIGAFVYYRRVIENQKNRIIGEIIKVSQKINAPAGTIALLEAAQKEIQFSKAVESIKDAIPPALLISGQNPLTLLHSALSDGLHEQDEEHCLDLAHSIRLILVELSDRLGQALKNEAELNEALSKLMQKKNKGGVTGG